MNDLLKQLITPTIITAIVSGLYGYFQKKKEEYQKYVYENKQNDFQELENFSNEIVEGGVANPNLKTILFKISQRINPYGREIKTSGKYQWIKDDGHIWNQLDQIERKINSQELTIEDLKELAYRIQISKRLLDVRLEQAVSPIRLARVWFYFLQYIILVFQLFLLFSLYTIGSKSSDINNASIHLPFALCLIPMIFLIFLIPESITDENDDSKNEEFIIGCSMMFAIVDAFTTYHLWKHLSSAIFVFMITFIFLIALTIFKSIIFGDSEMGKVSTIYIEEYRKLQKPKLRRKRFKDYFRKLKLSFKKEKTEKENIDT